MIIDGYYGPISEAAVKAFQQANGLTVDGIVDPSTWESLFSSTATQAPQAGLTEIK